MKKLILPAIIILFITLIACNKKESAPAPATNNTTTTVGGDNGTFLSAYNVSQFGTTFYTDSTINATFFDSPYSTHNNISAGVVSVNNTTLNATTSPINYYYTNNINFNVLNWQIAGNGTISATSFSYAPTHPSYTGYNVLPDTVTKSVGFNVVVNGVSNTNRPVYIFIAPTSGTGSVITKTIATAPATLNISSSELATYTSSNTISIKVEMFNYSNITVNAKQYAINANRTFQKYLYLK
jgi:hypothetical protein